MSDFDRALACLFVSPEQADSFLLGLGVACFCIFAGVLLGDLFELVIDLIRDKLGLPVARYVRWVKQQDKLDK